MSAEPKQEFLNYTADWFDVNIPLWNHLRTFMVHRDKILEIGSFEGRSTCWILQNMLSATGYITCIDTWEGSPEIPNKPCAESFDRFQNNTALARGEMQDVRTLRMRSVDGLAQLINEGQHNSFDLIYIDASHMAADVLTDACMAWPLLKPQGFLVFDDYLFRLTQPIDERPKAAIDAFTEMFNSQLQMFSCGFQYVVRKI